MECLGAAYICKFVKQIQEGNFKTNPKGIIQNKSKRQNTKQTQEEKYKTNPRGQIHTNPRGKKQNKSKRKNTNPRAKMQKEEYWQCPRLDGVYWGHSPDCPMGRTGLSLLSTTCSPTSSSPSTTSLSPHYPK